MNLFDNFSQLTLFDIPIVETVVNVASVPQRSPFRYPGGKTWLVPQVRAWLKSLNEKPALFVEPFAGGAINGLTVACEQLAGRVILVELDHQVAAVWKTILGNDSEWLVKRILGFELTRENLLEELSKKSSSIKHIAFQTILKNRTFHGGILAQGSSLVKNGENGKGLKSRWYPATLAKRIRIIASVRERISFIEGDGLAVIEKYKERKDVALFIDPPYTVGGKKAGARLYTHYGVDHCGLFKLIDKVKGQFLITYDHSEEVLEMAARHSLEVRTISMKNTHHARMKELLIGRKLCWLD